ncbi:unnamed protein product [Tilletia caries]|uniref:Transmembrane protein n=1 Tax=Tilletia caries TaxID=13290 RepID=A0ABN7J2N0_9BASI|nr:unnamed protein product [Tilletia caries]
MTDSIEHGEAIALQSTTLPMSTSTSSSHQDADATLTDLNESTGAGGVSAEADASTSDDQHQHYSGGSALAGAKQPDPSGAGGTQAAPQPSPDDYRNLRKSLLETRAILRTAADAFAVLASSRHFLVSVLECRSRIEAVVAKIGDNEACPFATEQRDKISQCLGDLFLALIRTREQLEIATGTPYLINPFEKRQSPEDVIKVVTSTATSRRQNTSTVCNQGGKTGDTNANGNGCEAIPGSSNLPLTQILSLFSWEQKDAINQLRVDIDDFAAIGKPMLLGMQKRQSDGNTLLSAAALLFASTVAGVGNSILFSTRGDSSNVSTRAVQILWTISLSLSIVTALIAATAAYWNSDMWGVRKALSVERKLSESVNKHQDPALSDTTQSDTEPDGLKRSVLAVHNELVWMRRDFRSVFQAAPVVIFSISVLTFFGGLCVSPLHLGLHASVQIATSVTSGASVVLLAFVIWTTVRSFQPSYLCKLKEKADKHPRGDGWWPLSSIRRRKLTLIKRDHIGPHPARQMGTS